MNSFLIRAFVKSIKNQKNANKDKTGKQRKSDNVSRVEISRPYTGWKKTMYSTISKWIWG